MPVYTALEMGYIVDINRKINAKSGIFTHPCIKERSSFILGSLNSLLV